MRAVVYSHYGEPEDLRVADVEEPRAGAGELLLEVRATSLNASDLEFLRATPGYVRMWGPLRPKFPVLGSDVAGVVRAVGPGVSGFAEGDEVFGDVLGSFGGFAELARVPAGRMVPKPASLSFEVASTLPQAACVAFQALCDVGQVRAGQSVLVNGAGGGAGCFAIQIAKHLGAEVTGVDNGSKQQCMRRVGADHVLDYARDDFTRGNPRYDLVLDLVGSRPLLAQRRVLTPTGRYLMVGGSVRRLLTTAALGPLLSFVRPKKAGLLMAEPNRGLLEVVALVEAGAVRPIVDSTVALEKTPRALRRLADARACGKLVVAVSSL